MAISTEQQAIFDWFRQGPTSGNLVVRARAGTGKTTTIMEAANNIAPEASILVAAFNTDIAKELSSRITNQRVEAKTLHGLGFKFVKYSWTLRRGAEVDTSGKRAWHLAERAAENISQSPVASIPKPMITLIKNLHTKAREITPFCNSIDDMMSLAIQFNLVPDAVWDECGWDLQRIADCALRAMDYAKEKVDQIDFADMIFLPLVHNMTRTWFDLVIADEAQDMTNAQLLLATRSCKKRGRICVVGDDRQAIYGFRGADSDSLNRLKRELKAKELGLTITRRCPLKVVELAAAIVPDFKAAPNAPVGVVRTISLPMLVGQACEGDFILSRTNAPLIKTCLSLLKEGKRAMVKGRDIAGQMMALVKKLKTHSIPELMSAVDEWLARETERAIEKMSDMAEERIDSINDQAQVLHALAEGLSTIGELEARMSTLFNDGCSQASIITCSTVHRVKGLEANTVFLLESTFRKSTAKEEQNIRYVAITRSKMNLVLVEGELAK